MLAFIIISLLVITCSIFVVTSNHLVHSAVALFFLFLGMVGIYLLLSLEFLAFVQIFLFVGTISILILFALMMIREYHIKKSNPRGGYSKWGLLTAFGFFIFFQSFAILYVKQISFLPSFKPSTLPLLGDILLHQLIVPFEIISLVLLAALMGTISLIRKKDNAS